MRELRRAVILLILCTAPATAEPAGEAAFATLDRVDGVSRVHFDLSLGRVVESVGPDGDHVPTAVGRIDLHGHYVAPQGYGGYATIGAYDGGVIDPGLGVFYVGRITDELAVIPTVGAVVPVGKVSGAPLDSGATRIADLARSRDDGTWVRVSTSAIWSHGHVVTRLDVGVDLGPDRYGRAGVGVAARLGGGQLGVEASVILGGGSPTYVAGEVAASYRHRFGRWAPFVAATYTPRYAPADQLEAPPGAGLLVGLDVTLR